MPFSYWMQWTNNSNTCFLLFKWMPGISLCELMEEAGYRQAGNKDWKLLEKALCIVWSLRGSLGRNGGEKERPDREVVCVHRIKEWVPRHLTFETQWWRVTWARQTPVILDWRCLFWDTETSCLWPSAVIITWSQSLPCAVTAAVWEADQGVQEIPS